MRASVWAVAAAVLALLLAVAAPGAHASSRALLHSHGAFFFVGCGAAHARTMVVWG